jgi:hypothetical protein
MMEKTSQTGQEKPHVSLKRRFARLLLAFNPPLQLASAGTY